MINIRQADRSDLAAITDIYNEAILTTTATFDTEPKSIEEQELWFKAHGAQYPLIVAELNGTVVGWASLSKWSDRCAYSKTAELSVYVKSGYRGHGIGRKLFEAIMIRGKEAGLHTIISRITSGNEVSIHLHEELGFEHIGVMKEVGVKHGLLLDVCLMQLIYN
jgi:phosphinothricin acetyltransferase